MSYVINIQSEGKDFYNLVKQMNETELAKIKQTEKTVSLIIKCVYIIFILYICYMLSLQFDTPLIILPLIYLAGMVILCD